MYPLFWVTRFRYKKVKGLKYKAQYLSGVSSKSPIPIWLIARIFLMSWMSLLFWEKTNYIISLRHEMLGDAIYTNSLDEAFIRSPERTFYAYYTGAPGHSIEGMSSRDQVQD